MCQYQDTGAGGQEYGSPKNCTCTKGKNTRGDELLTTLLNVIVRAQEWGLLSRRHHQTTSGSPETRNRFFFINDRAFQCLLPLMWTGGVLQRSHGEFIMRLPCSTVDPLGLRTRKHISTPMICIACSTPGTKSALLSIIISPTAGFKPLLVARSTPQNMCMGTCLPMTSSIAR